jgi:hypothetical protein
MNTKFSLKRFMDGLLVNGLILVGAFVMYAKTADLLSQFAPSEFFGYSNIAGGYGMVSALLVEGLFVVVKFSLSKKDNALEWGYKLLVMAVTLAISAAAQVIDGAMVRDTFSTQPALVQGLIGWLVPSVPTIVVLLAAGRAVFENMPDAVLADLAPEKDTKKTESLGAILKTVFRAQEANKVYATDTANGAKRKIVGGNGAKRNGGRVMKGELSAEDKAKIADLEAPQIAQIFGGTLRRAEQWKALASKGEL